MDILGILFITSTILFFILMFIEHKKTGTPYKNIIKKIFSLTEILHKKHPRFTPWYRCMDYVQTTIIGYRNKDYTQSLRKYVRQHLSTASSQEVSRTGVSLKQHIDNQK